MEYLRTQEVSAFIGQMDQSIKLWQNTLEVHSALSCLLFSTLVLEVLANLIKEEEINGILIEENEMKLFVLRWHYDLCQKVQKNQSKNSWN